MTILLMFWQIEYCYYVTIIREDNDYVNETAMQEGLLYDTRSIHSLPSNVTNNLNTFCVVFALK